MTDNTSDTPGGIETGVGEPSMEDILASIRRIIAEDDEVVETHLDIDGVVAIPDPRIELRSTDKAPAPTPSNDLRDAVIEIADAQETNAPETGAPETGMSVTGAQEDDDILILDQLVSDSQAASSLTDIETDELVIDQGVEKDEFNPVSSVVSDLENRLNEGSLDSNENSESDDDLILDEILSELDSENLVFTSDGNEDKGGIVTESGFDLSDYDVEESETEGNFALEEVPVLTEPEADGFGAYSSESDLDIVKSLMADLADTSFLDDEEMEDDLTAALVLEDADSEHDQDTPEPSVAAIENLDEIAQELTEPVLDESFDLVLNNDTEVESAAEEDQILNDILELTIQDEESGHDDLELSLDADDVVEDTDFDLADDNLLLQIAAKAEADADAMDSGKVAMAETASDERTEFDLENSDGPSTEDLLSELDLALAEVTQDDNQEEDALELEPAPEIIAELDEELEEDLETVEADNAETAELFIEPEEPEEMPKAVRKDTILDEVTETAAANAFAELSQAVDEKAVYTESGPRIGDVVQDALRPMLKEWLDENLKGIVERAVAKEVKRISSGK